jgi:thioredoxin reductase (NADPH)
MDIKDLVIIGGGPAGMTAGLYAARAAMKTLLLEQGMPGGQAATTDRIDNYPGFPQGISGPELMMQMDEQARRFGVEVEFARVNEIVPGQGMFTLKTESGDISARTLVVATGAASRALGVPGEQEFMGRGVSYCATCDGAFFQGKKVAVVGGGDSALQEGLFLTKFAEKVYIIHRRDEMRATKVIQEKAMKNEKIELILNAAVTSILGTDNVEAVKIVDVKTKEEKSVAVDGVFVYIGKKPASDLVKELVRIDEKGYIIVNQQMMTSVPGIFAAGDVRQTPLRQVVTAVADGAVAAVAAEHYIESLNG